jgi:hypothetical protein
MGPSDLILCVCEPVTSVEYVHVAHNFM